MVKGDMPELYLSPDLKIIGATDKWLAMTHTDLETIRGLSVFETFPENPGTKGAAGARALRASLGRVLLTKETDEVPVFRYDVENRDGTWEVRYWQVTNIPELNPDGSINRIVNRVEDVTTEVFATMKVGRTQRTYLFQNSFVALVSLLFLIVSIGFWVNPDGIDTTLGPLPPYDYYWYGIYSIGSLMVLGGLFQRRVGVEASGHIVLVPGLVANFFALVIVVGFHTSTVLTLIFAAACALRAYGLIQGWQEGER